MGFQRRRDYRLVPSPFLLSQMQFSDTRFPSSRLSPNKKAPIFLNSFSRIKFDREGVAKTCTDTIHIKKIPHNFLILDLLIVIQY